MMNTVDFALHLPFKQYSDTLAALPRESDVEVNGIRVRGFVNRLDDNTSASAGAGRGRARVSKTTWYRVTRRPIKV